MPVGRPVLSGRTRLAAGRRDCCVTVEGRTEGVGPSGRPIETWTPLTTLWASRRPLRADERFVAGQESAFAETSWHLPYAEALDPDLVAVPADRRLVYRGRIHEIRAASLIGRLQGLELLTLAKVDA